MNREFIHAELSTSVSGPEQVALVRAIEEASELQKEAAKALRFGLGNRYPVDGPTNSEKIRAEFRDVEAALMDAGIIEIVEDQRALGVLRGLAYNGCFTGDCPHETSDECVMALSQLGAEALAAVTDPRPNDPATAF